MRYREILLACVLLGHGCAEPTFQQMVPMAVDRWVHAVCMPPRYSKVLYVEDITECGDIKSRPLWGCFTVSTRVIEVSRKVPKEKVYQVLTHELGHSIAAIGHAPDNKGIMSEAVSMSVPYITKSDIDTICKDYSCPCKNPEDP